MTCANSFLQRRLQRLFGAFNRNSANHDQFISGSLSGTNGNLQAGNVKQLGQKANQFLIRFAVNWRSGQTDFQCAVHLANNSGARSARLNANRETDAVIFGSDLDQSGLVSKEKGLNRSRRKIKSQPKERK